MRLDDAAHEVEAEAASLNLPRYRFAAAIERLEDVLPIFGSNAEAAPPLLNGERQPKFVWKAGARHRVRLINITTDDIFTVSLMTSDGPVTWRPLTKDGASLPPVRCVPGPALQTIAVGETYDFEYQAPAGRMTIWLEVRTRGGKWQAQGHVIVK